MIALIQTLFGAKPQAKTNRAKQVKMVETSAKGWWS